MKKRVLMCSPKYFDVAYAINPWMNPDVSLNKGLAQKQHDDLKKLYQDLGVEVLELPPREGLPDMVFSANPGHADGDTFVVSNFKFPERQAESGHARHFFEMKGYHIKTISEDLYFEGQGDLIKAGSKYFMGYGKRSSLESAKAVEEAIGKKVIPLNLQDPYSYHLDTCLGPLSEEIAVINPYAFTHEDLKILEDSFELLIKTNEQDNQVMACNLVVVGEYVILSKGISSELRKAIESEGFIVYEADTSEFLKSGGSVKCMTMELW